MTKNISFEQAEEMLYEKHGDKIKLINFTRMYHAMSKFECNICHYVWETEAQSTIIKGRGCRKCADLIRKNKFMIQKDYIIDYINNNGGEFIKFLEDFRGKFTKILIKFNCGHEQETDFRTYRDNSKLCKNCAKDKGNKNKIRKIEYVKEYLLKNNLKFVEFPNGYTSSLSNITYICEFGHLNTKTIRSLFSCTTCRECKKIKMSSIFVGNKSIMWKGGITSIRKFIANNVRRWRKESIEFYNGKCVITGDSYDVVHHLYGFNLILNNAFEKLNLPIYENVSDYNKEDLNNLVFLVKEMHNSMLGVCLRKDVHQLFHKLYGHGNNTPEQFEEFRQRIVSGEIILPE